MSDKNNGEIRPVLAMYDIRGKQSFPLGVSAFCSGRQEYVYAIRGYF